MGSMLDKNSASRIREILDEAKRRITMQQHMTHTPHSRAQLDRSAFPESQLCRKTMGDIIVVQYLYRSIP